MGCGTSSPGKAQQQQQQQQQNNPQSPKADASDRHKHGEAQETVVSQRQSEPGTVSSTESSSASEQQQAGSGAGGEPESAAGAARGHAPAAAAAPGPANATVVAESHSNGSSSGDVTVAPTPNSRDRDPPPFLEIPEPSDGPVVRSRKGEVLARGSDGFTVMVTRSTSLNVHQYADPDTVDSPRESRRRETLSPFDKGLEEVLQGHGVLDGILEAAERTVEAPALHKKKEIPGTLLSGPPGKGKGGGSGGGGSGGGGGGAVFDVKAARIRFLERIPLFAGAPAADRDFLAELVAVLVEKNFNPNDVLVNEGDDGGEMYILSVGEVDIVSGDGQTFYSTLKSGSYFGELSLLREQKRSASIVARTFGRLLVLTKSKFREAISHHPSHLESMRKVAELREQQHENAKRARESTSAP